MNNTGEGMPVPVAAAAAAPLPYHVAGSGRPAWRVAPRRWAALAVAWVAALAALFLPGCDMSSSANRTEVRPTYVAYGLAADYTIMVAEGLRDASRAPGPVTLKRGDVAMPIACPLFLLGSAVFLLTPWLLLRRLRKGFGWFLWCLVSLLPAPWAMLLAGAINDNLGHFLYGFYLLAAAHTLAFAVLAWPFTRRVEVEA